MIYERSVNQTASPSATELQAALNALERAPTFGAAASRVPLRPWNASLARASAESTRTSPARPRSWSGRAPPPTRRHWPGPAGCQSPWPGGTPPEYDCQTNEPGSEEIPRHTHRQGL
jgi:hypothetical protein